jgi:hypothetical protein
MPSLLHRYATPFITGLFIISLVSGIALFLHVGTGSCRGMHEWLSMVLIVPFVLHLWRNWKPMQAYFKKPAFAVAAGLSLLAALAFVVPTGTSNRPDGPPQFALARTILNHGADQVAPLLNTSPDRLVVQLKAAGFTAATASDPLSDIAQKSGKDEFALVAALNTAGK